MESHSYQTRTRIFVGSLVAVLIGLAFLMLSLLVVHPEPKLAINTIGVLTIIMFLFLALRRWKTTVFVMTIVMALFAWTFSMTS